jgi:hypothetical protein
MHGYHQECLDSCGDFVLSSYKRKSIDQFAGEVVGDGWRTGEETYPS